MNSRHDIVWQYYVITSWCQQLTTRAKSLFLQINFLFRLREKPILKSRTPWIAVELYRHFGYYALGAVSCLLFTEIAKYTIGRLRPHFLTICAPEYTAELCKVSLTRVLELLYLQSVYFFSYAFFLHVFFFAHAHFTKILRFNACFILSYALNCFYYAFV